VLTRIELKVPMLLSLNELVPMSVRFFVHSRPNDARMLDFIGRSVDGHEWKFIGVITDAKDYVPNETTAGNTEENDMALMADGKTVMVVMRTDGDCNCAGATGGFGLNVRLIDWHCLTCSSAASTGHDECGVYRPYYQSCEYRLRY